MPRKAKTGNRIGKYEVIDFISSGGMAMSYVARIPGGEKVFLKQYKSPTTKVDWYQAYVEYQKELKRRIESSIAKSFSYRFIEFFEEDFGGKTYFQVFEFVEKGHDLEAELEKLRTRPRSVSWEQRVTYAKVLMAGIHALHEAQIVHSDLKPANIQLFADASIAAKYRLKLIDMDFSILPDRRAPWHGHEGYVGTDNYFSPEHLKGEAPQAASDVFTCGLILYELLTGTHPYYLDDKQEYAEASLSHRAREPRLAGELKDGVSAEKVTSIIHRCLSPVPEDRPTAREVNLVLNGRPVEMAPRPRPKRRPSPPPVESSRPTRIVETRPASPIRLELVSDSGKTLNFGVRTEVGKHLCRPLGDDAKYYAVSQFVVQRNDAGSWMMTPITKATNQTILNGKAVTAPTKLNEGDVLGVGNESKRIVKLPLTVRFS